MYKIYNNYGAPICGCETIVCDSWNEVESYVSEHEDDFAMGYAYIEEL